jgi:hypothetical protein
MKHRDSVTITLLCVKYTPCQKYLVESCRIESYVWYRMLCGEPLVRKEATIMIYIHCKEKQIKFFWNVAQ